VPRIYCLISFHPNQFHEWQITRENLINKIYNSYIAFRVARYSNDMTLKGFLNYELINTEKYTYPYYTDCYHLPDEGNQKSDPEP
jgi:hypothetical protein